MNHYSIYWIKEEFARYYFYRNDILYRFIRDYQLNQNRVDLKSQFDFITKEFTATSIIDHINTHKNRTNLHVEIEGNLIRIWNDKQFISLHIHKKHINFRSEIIVDAEEMLFPILRSFHPHLFIMGDDSINYGWISPVVQTKVDKVKPALYSYL